MDRAFKIIGALGLSISAGALLGMSTPTAMKASPEADWRLAARGGTAGKPIDLSQPAVIYSSLPEDLSPQIGYGSQGAYQAFYVDAPVRTGYTQAPDYSSRALEAHPARISADAAALAARDAQDRAEAAPQQAELASSKTIDMPAVTLAADHEPVFDATGDAPAMDAGGAD